MASGFLGVILAHRTLPPMIPMINVQSAPAAVVNTVGPFERPCETDFGRDSTDCAQIAPLLETLESRILLAQMTSVEMPSDLCSALDREAVSLTKIVPNPLVCNR